MRSRTTLLCFDAHAQDGKVWAIRHRGKWSRHPLVTTFAAGQTIYKGPAARQPKAYLQYVDVKVQRLKGGGAVITNGKW